jgi:hypothetical protein
VSGQAGAESAAARPSQELDTSAAASAAADAAPAERAGSGDAAAPTVRAAEAQGTALSLKFLLRNFCEMNKLWTRMQRNLPHSDARDVIRTVRPVTRAVLQPLPNP